MRCLRFIERAYGTNGYHTVYNIVETGKEGGLYQVFKKIADAMIETYAENQIGYELHKYYDGLTADEKLAAVDEYLRKYGHLLP